MKEIWKTSRRTFDLARKPLVMGILNVTPDSFSDGGRFSRVDSALHRAEEIIAEGADILDIGGESTRPNSQKVSVVEEIRRTAPVIEAIVKRFDTAVSIDTTKSEVAEAAVKSGAEIINDISGLRFDENLGRVAAENGVGLVLMHLRGEFETMHELEPVEDIFAELREGFSQSISKSIACGVQKEFIALDVGIGFSKTFKQNLQIIGRLNEIIKDFSEFPFLVGASRKSFIGKILGDVSAGERLGGSLAAASIAVFQGANILRVHDIAQTRQAVEVAAALRK